MKKLTMPGNVWYWTKPTQSSIFLVQYRTKGMDAGMALPVIVIAGQKIVKALVVR
jgi:hypothetical protein